MSFYFGSTIKDPPVIIASGIAARESRPRRCKRRRPTRKRRKRPPTVTKSVSEKWRHKHDKKHLSEYAKNYRPDKNDEFSKEDMDANEVPIDENTMMRWARGDNAIISRKKGQIGGRRRSG